MLPDPFRLIGSDRYLSAEEVDRAAEPHPATSHAWDVYASQFQGFTGATIDPDFHRLAHPALRTGRVRLDPGTTVLVAGTDASLLTQIDAVKAVRGRVRIFTSPSGADLLGQYGITPDLVVIGHQTPLAARHAARHAQRRSRRTWVGKDHPLVVAEWRTPAALLSDISPQRLFAPASSPTWGLWQATAVALAAEARASRIALVGVDATDPHDASLKALLELIARIVPIVGLDCGAAKRGWVSGSVQEVAGTKLGGPLEANLWTAPTVCERMHEAQVELAELAPTLDRARRLLAVALEARVMGDAAPAAALEAAVDEMMSWRQQSRVRILVQECLGGSFLPRLWRTGVNPSEGRGLLRPLLLAMREVTGRADALAEAVQTSQAA